MWWWEPVSQPWNISETITHIELKKKKIPCVQSKLVVRPRDFVDMSIPDWIWGGTLSHVIDNLATAWPLRPAIGTYRHASSCSRHRYLPCHRRGSPDASYSMWKGSCIHSLVHKEYWQVPQHMHWNFAESITCKLHMTEVWKGEIYLQPVAAWTRTTMTPQGRRLWRISWFRTVRCIARWQTNHKVTEKYLFPI